MPLPKIGNLAPAFTLLDEDEKKKQSEEEQSEKELRAEVDDIEPDDHEGDRGEKHANRDNS